MMAVHPVQRLDMQRDGGVLGEGLKEFAHQFGVEGADPVCGNWVRNTR